MNTPDTNAYAVQAEQSLVAVYCYEDPLSIQQQLGQSAVLLTKTPNDTLTMVSGRMKNLSSYQTLEYFVGQLAGRTLEPTVQDSPPQPAVSFEAATDAFYEHLGHTARLLTPLSAVRLAAAIRKADTAEGSPQLFGVQASTVEVSDLRQRYYEALARRRASDRQYGRRTAGRPQAELLAQLR